MELVQDRPALSGRAGRNDEVEPFALADGTVIALQDTGPADSPDVVLLVAGWTQDHTSWADVVAELHRERPDLRVVAFDARGHGWSDAGPQGSNTIDQLGDDVAALITRHLAGRRVVVAGHSLGGPVIMAFAERHPVVVAESVAGIAFVATSAAGLGRDLLGLAEQVAAPVVLVTRAIAKLGELSRARVTLHHPALIAGFIRAGFYGPGAATAVNRRRTAAQFSRAQPATTAALVGEMARHDRRHSLPGLAGTPVAVLVGTKDGLCPVAHSRALAEALPHAELVVYPGAGHMLPYERPAEVAAQLAALAGRTAALHAVPEPAASDQVTSKTAGS